METIVEAIRHLEGDHLFSDERNNNGGGQSSTSRSCSPPRAMEICSSSSSSPSHVQSRLLMEAPLALTSTAPALISASAGFPTTVQTGVPVSTTVTSLKHHVLNRIARSSELEEQPINLEFRPGQSRSPSPSSYMNQQAQGIQLQYQMQPQQLRPGVIVVKHS